MKRKPPITHNPVFEVPVAGQVGIQAFTSQLSGMKLTVRFAVVNGKPFMPGVNATWHRSGGRKGVRWPQDLGPTS
jgi:hypothetical protein